MHIGWIKLCVGILAITSFVLSVMATFGPRIMVSYSDQRYVLLARHKEEIGAIRLQITENRDEAAAQREVIIQKLERMDARQIEDNKEILRYLRK